MNPDTPGICDICGQRWKLVQLRKNWKGQMVCPPDYEPRNAQDFVRGVRDKQKVRNARPESADVFIEPTSITPDDL